MFVVSSSLRQLSRAAARYVLLPPTQATGYLHLPSFFTRIFLTIFLIPLPSTSPLLLRASSSAAASTTNAAEIDWSAVRAKMMTDETRADADRAKEAFQKRLSAATSVGQVAEVDWSYFKKGMFIRGF